MFKHVQVVFVETLSYDVRLGVSRQYSLWRHIRGNSSLFGCGETVILIVSIRRVLWLLALFVRHLRIFLFFTATCSSAVFLFYISIVYFKLRNYFYDVVLGNGRIWRVATLIIAYSVGLVELTHKERLDPVSVARVLVGYAGQLAEVVHHDLWVGYNVCKTLQTIHGVVLHSTLVPP